MSGAAQAVALLLAVLDPLGEPDHQKDERDDDEDGDYGSHGSNDD